MKNIAIIPARGGSKRIPRKNIKDFLGKPIIAYSISAAINSQLFDEIMVSTDDNEIAEIAKQYGAKVPFMRSAKCSNDFATTIDVIDEVISCYEKTNIKFDNLCCIYPTAPLISPERLKESFALLNLKNYDSVFPVVPFSYPVLRGLRLNKERVQMVWPEHLNSRSQDLETIYHDAGQFYMAKTESMKLKKTLWTDNTGAIILSEMEVQDIDNEADWKLAELKYKLLNEA
ncbi:MAG: pseudaminic acid cytidylyltransferase [Bacteroidales bacterium]|nr:pseudaminic acid cytidylyltransferase [Bacteroidales bacterium]